MKNKTKKISMLAMLLITIVTLTGCGSWSRTMKSLSSDFSGGLNRHIVIKNQAGEITYEYEGKIDIEDNDNRIKFIDENDKWTIIYPGQSEVIITEK